MKELSQSQVSNLIKIGAVVLSLVVIFSLVRFVYATLTAQMTHRTCATNLTILAAGLESHAGMANELNQAASDIESFLDPANIEKLGISPAFMQCPKATGAVSYGINANLFGRAWDDIGPEEALIADCDSPEFSSLENEIAFRHKTAGGKWYGLAILKNKTIVTYYWQPQKTAQSDGSSSAPKARKNCWADYSACQRYCSARNSDEAANCNSACWDKYNACQNKK